MGITWLLRPANAKACFALTRASHLPLRMSLDLWSLEQAILRLLRLRHRVWHPSRGIACG